MQFIFGNGPVKQRLIWSLKMAFNHGKILAIFAFTYKLIQCLLANLRKKACAVNSLVAGAIGAIVLLNTDTDMSIHSQIGYYLSARVMEGFWLKLVKEGYLPKQEMFHFTYTLIWGLVMYLFELDKKILNKSLVSSMEFLYKDSDK